MNQEPRFFGRKGFPRFVLMAAVAIFLPQFTSPAGLSGQELLPVPPVPGAAELPPPPEVPSAQAESALYPLVPVSQMTIRFKAGKRLWLKGSEETALTPLETVRQDLNKMESSVDFPQQPCPQTLYSSTVGNAAYCRYLFVCHDPLYFEEIPLERYGDVFNSHLQPFISAGHFFGTLPCVPFKMVANRIGEMRGQSFAQDSMGNWRPGVAEGR